MRTRRQLLVDIVSSTSLAAATLAASPMRSTAEALPQQQKDPRWEQILALNPVDRMKLLYLAMPADVFDYRDPNKSDPERRLREIETILEFADFYANERIHSQQDISTVNILYPGSGHDIMQLIIGLQLLHNSPIQTVHFTYTEIDLRRHSWYDGYNDLGTKLNRKLLRYEALDLIKLEGVHDQQHEKDSELEGAVWLSRRYDMTVPTANGDKTMSLTLRIGDLENRHELSTEEQECFNPEFVDAARGTIYWPAPEDLPENPFFPKYASDELFDQADIIISHRSGNLALLRFDYMRALLSGLEPKQRVVFTEHRSEYPEPFLKSVGLDFTVHQLTNNFYGYATTEDDQVIVLTITPQQ